MLIKKPADIRSSEITPKKLYQTRREFIKAAGMVGGAAIGVEVLTKGAAVLHAVQPAAHGRKLNVKPNPTFSNTNGEPKNTWEQITTYNNYYEFGIDKDQPAELARNFKTDNWTIEVSGECAKKGKFPLEDLIKDETIEERVYRMRCVEAWSMVIPWDGIPLASIIKKLQPTAKAKYIKMSTALDKQMPGIRSDVLDWPYVEGLRMDEAMNPLTIFAVGLYGEALPNQDGAPIRLVVPWKYGFKGVKSINKIEFTEKQPLNTWQRTAPNEYGFYANVNPNVDHPRWSQATERRIGEFFKRKTLMFNGYGDQVASLYTGLDLKKNF
ncbi:MAG TPA: protein-methionine-sulfoxide reductase catalytic subunit MsrP [Vicinamibacterales bacterium]|nr:protein-methionine-sulfoxide reductase catalytic subunit MsrP [Vicinamibacterales bacterium]